MSVNFPNTNDKEYLRLLDLANGNSMLVYSVWIATDGNVDNIFSLKELKVISKEYLIKKTNELRAEELKIEKNYLPNEELVKKDPTFNFSYEQREEIKNSLLHIASIDSKTNTLLDIDEISKNLNEKFFKEKLKKLSKIPYYSRYKTNYEKLLDEKTLREFVFQVREDFYELDNRNELTVESELKVPVSTKLLVRFIPEEKSGLTLGLKKFSNFDQNWNILQELFSNITERGEGRFQQMLEELDKILPYKPYLYYLKKHLTDLESVGKHSPKVTQFMRAFDKTRINYTSSFIEQDGNFYLNKIGNSNQKSKERIILYNWQNNFNNLYFSEDSFGNIIFNKNKAQKALNNYNKLFKIITRLESINENSLNDVKILLEEIGIIVDKITLNKIVYKPITDKQKEGLSEEEIEKLHHETSLNNFKAFVSDLDKLFLGARRAYTNSLTHLINKKDFGNSNKKRLLTPINDTQSFLLPLAKEQTFFEEDLYNSTPVRSKL